MEGVWRERDGWEGGIERERDRGIPTWIFHVGIPSQESGGAMGIVREEVAMGCGRAREEGGDGPDPF